MNQQPKKLCLVCGIKPRWYDRTCGRMLRNKHPIRRNPYGTRGNLTKHCSRECYNKSCVVCREKPRWYDNKKKELTPYCSKTCYQTGNGQKCAVCGIKPRWYDLNLGDFVPYCSKACRISIAAQGYSK